VLHKISISNKCCYFELSISINESWIKVYHGFSEIWSSTTVFNIDNTQKCFLSIRSSY